MAVETFSRQKSNFLTRLNLFFLIVFVLLFFLHHTIQYMLYSAINIFSEVIPNQFLITFALCGTHSFSSLGIQLMAEGQGTIESSALLW